MTFFGSTDVYNDLRMRRILQTWLCGGLIRSLVQASPVFSFALFDDDTLHYFRRGVGCYTTMRCLDIKKPVALMDSKVCI